MNKSFLLIPLLIWFSCAGNAQTIVNDSEEGLTKKEVLSINRKIEKIGNTFLTYQIIVTDNFWPYDDIESFGKNILDTSQIQRVLIISPQLKKVEIFNRDNHSKFDWSTFKNEKLIPYLQHGQTVKAIKNFLETIN